MMPFAAPTPPVHNDSAWVPFLAFVIVLSPLAAGLVGLFFKRSHRLLTWMTPFCSFCSLLAASLLVVEVGKQAVTIQIIPFLTLYLDSLSIYFVLLVNLVALFASFGISRYLTAEARRNPDHNPAGFYLRYNLFYASLLLVPLVDNLVVLWIILEITTLCSTVLVSYRNERAALEAAWKLLIITSTGVIFALLGTLFLANSLPASHLPVPERTDLMRWSILANQQVAGALDHNYVMLSFLFVLLGYGVKAGLAPAHTWLPDGHGQAPAPVSALLSGVMLKMALYAILRFYTVTNLALQDTTYASFARTLLVITGLFSLLLATPFILKRNRFKRVLAYHSLEHIGMITFGIGLGTPVALFGALLHSLNHALTKALAFLAYGSIQYAYQEELGGDNIDVDEDRHIQGVLRAMPFSGTILAFGGLALAGSPPFSLFMSEFIILWAAITQMQPEGSLLKWGSVLLIVLTLALIYAGLVGHLARLLLGPAPFEPIEPSPRRSWVLVPFIVLVAMVFLFGLVVPNVLVDFPQILKNSAAIVLNGAGSIPGVGQR